MQLLSVFIVTLVGVSLWANEAPPPAAAGGHGEKKEEKSFSGAQTDEWQQVLKDYSTAKVKYENELKTLEVLKSHFKESEESLTSKELEEIKKQTKAVKDAEENYKRYQYQYNMRFPEKGLEKGRTYKRKDLEEAGSVEEKPHTIDAKVKNLNKKINSQYGVRVKPKKTKLLIDDRQKTRNEEQPDLVPSDGVTDKIKLEK